MNAFDNEFDEIGGQLRSAQLPKGRDDLGNGQGDLRRRITLWNEQVASEGWQATLAPSSGERPVFERGVALVERGRAVVVGISPGNSYFARMRLTRLFRSLRELHSQVYITPMDKPSEHNYRALGYSERDVRKKVHKKSAEIGRNIRSALEAAEASADCFAIVDWARIKKSAAYQHAIVQLRELYTKDRVFHEEFQATVKQLVVPQLSEDQDADVAVHHAEEYLFEELAFLLAARDILGEQGYSYLYHKPWPIFEKLVGGQYGMADNLSIGFVELRIETV